MSYLPDVYDLNDPDILDAVWLQSDKADYDPSGNLLSPRTEEQGRQKPNAKFGNGVSEVIRQLAAAWQGTVMPDAMRIASWFQLPNYTTAGLPDAAEQGAGSLVWDTTTESLKASDGADWNEVGGVEDLFLHFGCNTAATQVALPINGDSVASTTVNIGNANWLAPFDCTVVEVVCRCVGAANYDSTTIATHVDGSATGHSATHELDAGAGDVTFTLGADVDAGTRLAITFDATTNGDELVGYVRIRRR